MIIGQNPVQLLESIPPLALSLACHIQAVAGIYETIHGYKNCYTPACNLSTGRLRQEDQEFKANLAT